MTNPKLTLPTDSALAAELAKFRQHQALLDKTELVAHIGHYEWSYDLDCLLSCSEEYAHPRHDRSADTAGSRQLALEAVKIGIVSVSAFRCTLRTIPLPNS